MTIQFAMHHRPEDPIFIAVLVTLYGFYLIKRGIEGDTLLPGTTFTYLPRWFFIAVGLLLQLPLPAAIWYAKYARSLL